MAPLRITLLIITTKTTNIMKPYVQAVPAGPNHPTSPEPPDPIQLLILLPVKPPLPLEFGLPSSNLSISYYVDHKAPTHGPPPAPVPEPLAK